ncbi:MAG TPA: APC family permease [Bryobacteraceae bacterium]|jgi:APA family basic amino acid/polyamine antiporter
MRHSTGTSLLRVLGLFFGVAVSIGGTLGVGILRQPGPVASYLREPWLIMLLWFAGAVYSSLGALNVAELATLIPRAGGFYVYAREAMGDTAGFAVAWCDFLANISAAAYAAMAAVEFLGRVEPLAAIHPQFAGIGFILMFAAIQWFGIRISGRVQQIASAVAAVALFALVIACFTIHGSHSMPAPPAPVASFGAALVLAIQSIVVTYDGWYEPIYFAEETRHPERRIPRAMFSGLALVSSIYLLLNLAFLRALGPAGLAASKFAAADCARLIFGKGSEIFLSALGIVILLTLLHVVLMTATRILYAVGRDGLFWSRAALVAANGTPRRALAVSALVAISLVLTGTLDQVIAMAGFFYVANYCWSYISLLVLRARRPDAERPFRVPWYPLPTLLALAASLAFLSGAVFNDRANSLYALLLLAASYPLRLVGKLCR